MSHATTSVEERKENLQGGFFDGVKNPYIEESDWGWPIDPVGLRYILNVLQERYELPLMIVDDGMMKALLRLKPEEGLLQTMFHYFDLSFCQAGFP